MGFTEAIKHSDEIHISFKIPQHNNSHKTTYKTKSGHISLATTAMKPPPHPLPVQQTADRFAYYIPIYGHSNGYESKW